MNPNARHRVIEVKLSDAETSLLDQIRGGLGRSPFFRDLMHREARTHGKPPAPPKEARQCRAGPIANRASVGMRNMRSQV